MSAAAAHEPFEAGSDAALDLDPTHDPKQDPTPTLGRDLERVSDGSSDESDSEHDDSEHDDSEHDDSEHDDSEHDDSEHDD
ncbi:MAG: hypothetical protein ACTHQ3_02630, partial [Motilibacteraceae bacterium]